MSFEWQTEEDYDWDEEPEIVEPPQPKRRLWPWLALVGMLLVVTAVFLLYRQLSQRVELATGDVEADLAASYAVVQQAAQNRDHNLFSSLLSGRDFDWAVAQENNMATGLLFDRPGFLLEWQPSVAETAVFSQTLSPDLTSAELTTLQNYTLNIGNGLTETVTLERLDVYRLGEDRWLFAPPEREFWGVRRRLEGQLVSVRYPARDEQLVHRLAADLEAKLVQLCNSAGYTCPPEARVRLIFSPEPDSLAQATFLAALTQDREANGDIWRGAQPIVLPTPTLVGLPQNEVAYRAIFRGYAQQMLTQAINDLTGWVCCENVPYYRAVLSYQLYELGVVEWPLTVTAASPTAVSLPDGFNLGDGALVWHAPFPEIPTEFDQTPAPYVVIDFLVNKLQLPPSQIALNLVNYKQFIFGQWLTELAGPTWTEATLNDAFQKYAAVWQGEPEAAVPPEADLALLCQNQFTNEQALYRYNFAQASLTQQQSMAGSDFFFTALPDGAGLAVAGVGSSGQPETYLLLQDGSRIDVNWDQIAAIIAYPPLAVPTIADPNGRYLLWTVSPGYTAGIFYALTDLNACRAGEGCDALPLGGYPIWSPTAERLITLTVTAPWWGEAASNGLMLLRDTPTGEAANSPGFGSSIFWLDETGFGFLSQGQNGNQQIVSTDVLLSPPQTIIDNTILRTRLPEEIRPDALLIQYAQPLPTDPRILLIVAEELEAGSPDGYLIWYDRAADLVTRVVPLPPEGVIAERGYRFSPDGRFFLMTSAGQDESSTNLLLQDNARQQSSVFRLEGETLYPRHFYASWSPDGQWLAMPELGYIRLWQNGRDEQLLNFDNLDCTNAAWVARMEP
ncbi:MAG: hypothetical protein H6656_13650 [Ardenticatenaceae bacterium]|nr:hypothetical protein [Ardenticatenaceae bacterium]